jgi:hypothetical protein
MVASLDQGKLLITISESRKPRPKSVHHPVNAGYNTFNTCRHLISANSNRELRAAAFATWRKAVGVAA